MRISLGHFIRGRSRGTSVVVLAFVLASATLGVVIRPTAGSPGAALAPLGAVAAVPALRVHSGVSPAVAAGALDYTIFGCSTCHGLSGRGGVRVPNVAGTAMIPALNTSVVRQSLSVTTLRYIIQHGIVLKSGTRVYMPVWGAVLSNTQIDDLVAYIRAGLPTIAGIAPQPVRTDLGPVVEGQQLYIRFGCVVCHAYNGFGGVPNPSSPDKLVPPLRGKAFDKQFTKDSDIAYVIKHGSIIGQAPIVSMPVWSGLLSDQQIKSLIAYIRSLR